MLARAASKSVLIFCKSRSKCISKGKCDPYTITVTVGSNSKLSKSTKNVTYISATSKSNYHKATKTIVASKNSDKTKTVIIAASKPTKPFINKPTD